MVFFRSVETSTINNLFKELTNKYKENFTVNRDHNYKM